MFLKLYCCFSLMLVVTGMDREKAYHLSEWSTALKEESLKKGESTNNPLVPPVDHVPSFMVRFQSESPDSGVVEPCVCSGAVVISEHVGFVLITVVCADRIRIRRTLGHKVFAVLAGGKYPIRDNMPMAPIRHQSHGGSTDLVLVSLMGPVDILYSAPSNGRTLAGKWMKRKNWEAIGYQIDLVENVTDSLDKPYFHTSPSAMTECDSGAPLYMGKEGTLFLLGLSVDDHTYANVYKLMKEVTKAAYSLWSSRFEHMVLKPLKIPGND